MDIVVGREGRQTEIADLFAQVFAASESPEEGARVGALAKDLMATTPDADLYVFSAREDADLLGCILFSRLVYDRDDRQVFILSPVAVQTQRQRTGVGQNLIRFGLNTLRQAGIDFVTTYGDPDYYRKTGFHPISEDFARAPVRLSHPHGWLGQSLSGSEQAPLLGACRCVDALNRPELW